MKHLFNTLALCCLTQLPLHSMAQNVTTEVRHGQTSWVLRSDQIEMAVTRLGGHMAPVTFYRESPDPVMPYYISPWQEEGHAEFPARVLAPLRGDFFCLPFGGNGRAWQGEQHEPHGETATGIWTMEEVRTDAGGSTLVLSMQTRIRPGKVTKMLSLLHGQNAVYSTHVIEGFSGPAPLGHHATLAMPETEGAIRIFHSPVEFGMTNPGVFSNPASREYQQLEPGRRFESISAVPSIFKNAPDADLSRLPARKGFADLVMLIQKIGETPSWVAALNAEEGWMWFSLKDPRVLRGTVFWLENGGRHGFPWNGRNNCVGIEEVTAFFADGLAASIEPNQLNSTGIPTTTILSDSSPARVHYVQGVTRIPDGFEDVSGATFHDDGHLTFHSGSGRSVNVPVRWKYVMDGRL